VTLEVWLSTSLLLAPSHKLIGLHVMHSIWCAYDDTGSVCEGVCVCVCARARAHARARGAVRSCARVHMCDPSAVSCLPAL
jgi:hypothetical protein